MMAINHDELAGERVWLDRSGKVALTGVSAQRLEKAAEAARLDAELLAAATMQVKGKPAWYALRTAKCCEIALCESLVDSGVDAVVPMRTVQCQGRRAGARSRLVHRPVLSGMIFVSMVLSDAAVAGLLRVRGVAAIIGSQGRPHPIGDKEMNGFMELAQAGAFDLRQGAHGLKAGSRVRIKDGPFAEFEAVMQGYVRSRHVRVLAHLFGRAVTMELTLAQIEKLD